MVYAEGTPISLDRLTAESPVFKQIPYQIYWDLHMAATDLELKEYQRVSLDRFSSYLRNTTAMRANLLTCPRKVPSF